MRVFPISNWTEMDVMDYAWRESIDLPSIYFAHTREVFLRDDFATPKRKFILAGTPGHIQYTRNVVTGASTADVVMLLVDAHNGILEQTRRHAFIASLLGVPHLVLCVNKMDLVGFDQEAYEGIVDEFREFATKLQVTDLRFVPVSALDGDNIVEHSARMPWYHGSSVLELFEEIHVASGRKLVDCRFPVQYVIRPHTREHQDYRGYAGQIVGGTWRVRRSGGPPEWIHHLDRGHRHSQWSGRGGSPPDVDHLAVGR